MNLQIELLKKQLSDLAYSYRAMARIEGWLSSDERKRKARLLSEYNALAAKLNALQERSKR